MLGSRRPRLFRGAAASRRSVMNHPGLEELEVRNLLSTTIIPANLLTVKAHPSVSVLSVTNPAAAPLTPMALRDAYLVNKVQFLSGGSYITGNGAGQTIAIADAYNDPDIAKDLATFDSTFSLPAPPSFTVLNENGGTNLTGIANSPASSDWALEESLDVEWSHTIAPAANIVLFEANSNNNVDLDTADFTAANPATYAALGIPAAGVVSNSFGSTEGTNPTLDETQADEEYEDTNYMEPISAEGTVTVVASAGDNGVQNYPSTSPYVLSVGGTTVSLKAGPFGTSWSSETAWSVRRGSGTGGGTSLFEPIPTYQSNYGLTNSSGDRETPDVAWDANPSSGVYVTDTFDYPNNTYVGSIGGTSLAAPLWSGLLTIVNQGRALNGQGVLANAQEAVYTIPGSDFHDITSGSNSVASAGPGYDEVTGFGSPIANKVVPDLVNASTGQVVVPGAVTYDDSQGIPANLTTSIESNDTHGAPVAVEASAGAATSVAYASTAAAAQTFRALPANAATVSLPPASQVARADAAEATGLSVQGAAIVDGFHGHADVAPAATPAAATPGTYDLPAGPDGTLARAAVPTTGVAATPLPATVAGATSDAVFADYGTLPALSGADGTPVAVLAGEETHSIDLALAAGMVLALGGSWSAAARAEENRKHPALRS